VQHDEVSLTLSSSYVPEKLSMMPRTVSFVPTTPPLIRRHVRSRPRPYWISRCGACHSKALFPTHKGEVFPGVPRASYTSRLVQTIGAFGSDLQLVPPNPKT
jgi:hypothetical protein